MSGGVDERRSGGWADEWMSVWMNEGKSECVEERRMDEWMRG